MFDNPSLFPELKHLQPLVDAIAGSQNALLELCIAVQQVAAPTHAEGERAAWVEAKFHSLGLLDVMQDGSSNVYARLPGARPGPALMLSAHTDTVFPAETDLTIRRDDGRHRVAGPGLGDNSRRNNGSRPSGGVMRFVGSHGGTTLTSGGKTEGRNSGRLLNKNTVAVLFCSERQNAVKTAQRSRNSPAPACTGG